MTLPQKEKLIRSDLRPSDLDGPFIPAVQIRSRPAVAHASGRYRDPLPRGPMVLSRGVRISLGGLT